MTSPAQGLLVPGRRGALVRVRTPLITGGVLAAAAVGVALRDPHRPGSWGVCPFLLLTGQPCPLCGGLRAVHDLSRGDLAGAWGSNALVVVLLPVVAVVIGAWTVRRWRGSGREEAPLTSPRAAWLWLALLGAWWVARLLPGTQGWGP